MIRNDVLLKKISIFVYFLQEQKQAHIKDTQNFTITSHSYWYFANFHNFTMIFYITLILVLSSDVANLASNIITISFSTLPYFYTQEDQNVADRVVVTSDCQVTSVISTRSNISRFQQQRCLRSVQWGIA